VLVVIDRFAGSVWRTSIKHHRIDASVFVIDNFVSRFQGRRSENDDHPPVVPQHIPDNLVILDDQNRIVSQAWLPSPTNAGRWAAAGRANPIMAKALADTSRKKRPRGPSLTADILRRIVSEMQLQNGAADCEALVVKPYRRLSYSCHASGDRMVAR
jgi:hypothetical protein